MDQLVDMGFEKERAQLALKNTGGRKSEASVHCLDKLTPTSVSAAIDWLDTNAEKSTADLIEESKTEPAVQTTSAVENARSLVCNECGKKFRDQAAAEFHASKTEHTDFSESVDEIAPLTEEEKNNKLSALREKLAAKKAVQSEQDIIDKKRNEQINRKKTKESQDMKEDLKKKEQIKDAEKKRQERQDDIDAKKRIQAKIAADKEERRLRTEKAKAGQAGLAPVQPAPTPVVAAAPPSSKPTSEYTETRLRLQTASGNIVKVFPVDTTLFEVAEALNEESGLEVESFTQNFPRKVFNNEYFGETLKELKMVPSASLIVK